MDAQTAAATVQTAWRSPLAAVTRAAAYATAGGALIVAMAILVVIVAETPRKAAAIVLAVTGVWLLSRAGAILYRLLFGVAP